MVTALGMVVRIGCTKLKVECLAWSCCLGMCGWCEIFVSFAAVVGRRCRDLPRLPEAPGDVFQQKTLMGLPYYYMQTTCLTSIVLH